MYCDKCGSRNDFDAVFCKKCGFNFNKQKKKRNLKQLIDKKVKELLLYKKIIIEIVFLVCLIFIILVLSINNSSLSKYQRYLEKNGYECKRKECIKKDNDYNLKIKLDDRLIYSKSKLNQSITFIYAKDGLGYFEIKDSLSKFNCALINGEVNTSSCIDDLNIAGYDYYLKQMNEMYNFASNIPW